MITETELLQYIHETAEMGVEGISDVLGYAEGSRMQDVLRTQMEEYRRLEQDAEKLLSGYGQDPKDVGMMAKTGARMMSAGKLMADRSISKIAEMTIEGNTMGITKTLKHLHDYSGDDPKVVDLTNVLLETQRRNVEQLQSYL